jgi:hypothetical protein
MKGLRPLPKGHKFGGDQFAGYREKLRAAMLKSVTPTDFQKLARKMLAQALKGNVAAAHELFDRILGKSAQPITGEDSGAVKVEVRERILIELAKCTEEYERLAREHDGRITEAHRN